LHSEKKEFHHNLFIINNNELEALDGKISMFAEGNRYAAASHEFSFDIDLFGAGSLFQYLNRTITGYGTDILAGWLNDPFRLNSDLLKRQETVRELSYLIPFRQKFMAAGMNVPLEKENISALSAWLNEDNEPGTDLKKLLNLILPALAIISLILLLASIVPYQVFVFCFLVNLFYVGTELKKTNRIHNSLTGNYNSLSSVRRLLDIVGNEDFKSPSLKEMRQEVSGKDFSASVAVRKLERLIQAFDSRLNVIAGFMLNGLFLWDLQCVHRLMLWKKEYRELFPSWLAILGEIDAYSSLANYSCNNPSFSWPVRSDSGIMFSATSLGHPLIDHEKRVSNDFTLDAHGCIVIITGANMAGKSTFLRTVAVNYVLAMCGAPVCASSMVFTPIRLFTSMRTTDSLQGNESYFYAELKRLRTLKELVSAGEPVSADWGRAVCRARA
jgi:DNA mismatch repair ATPase MutS